MKCNTFAVSMPFTKLEQIVGLPNKKKTSNLWKSLNLCCTLLSSNIFIAHSISAWSNMPTYSHVLVNLKLSEEAQATTIPTCIQTTSIFNKTKNTLQILLFKQKQQQKTTLYTLLFFYIQFSFISSQETQKIV